MRTKTVEQEKTMTTRKTTLRKPKTAKPRKKTLTKKTPVQAEPTDAEMLAQVETVEETLRRIKEAIANFAKVVQGIQKALGDDLPSMTEEQK